jgi:hypothetical protein
MKFRFLREAGEEAEILSKAAIRVSPPRILFDPVERGLPVAPAQIADRYGALGMCEEFSWLLSAYIDDEVTPDERERVETHLAGCVSCREELRALKEAVVFSGLLPELPSPAELRSRILDRTVYRRSAWARFKEAAVGPFAWRASLGLAGVAGLVAFSLHYGPRVAKTPSPFAAPGKRIAKAPAKKLGGEKSAEKIAKAPVVPSENGFERFLNDIKESLQPAPVESVPKSSKNHSPAESKTQWIADAVARLVPDVRSDGRALPKVKSVSPRATKRIPDVPAAKAGRTLIADLMHARRILPKVQPEPFDGVPTVGTPSPMPDYRADPDSDPSTRYGAPATRNAGNSSNSDTENAIAAAPPANPIAEATAKPSDAPPSLKVGDQDAARRLPVDELVDRLNATALSSAPQVVEWKFARIRIKL